MAFKYITENLDSLSTFAGLGTGRKVSINSHEDRFLILTVPTKGEWIEVGNEFEESCRRQLYKGLEEFVENLGVIRAFIYDPHGNSAFGYLHTEWLMKRFKNVYGGKFDCSKQIIEQIKKMSIQEQKLFWNHIQPKSYVEHLQAVREKLHQTYCTFEVLYFVENFEFLEGVEYLIGALAKPAYGRKENRFEDFDKPFIKNEGYKQRVLQFLVYLRQRGYLLFCIGTYVKLLSELRALKIKSTTGTLSLAIRTCPSIQPDILTLVIRETKSLDSSDAKECMILSSWFLMSTSIEDLGDLSTEILEIAVKYKTGHYSWFEDFIHIFKNDNRYKHITFPTPKRVSKNVKRDAKQRSLKWALDAYPQLEEWIDLLEEYIGKKLISFNTGTYSSAGYIVHFFASLDTFPSPESLNGNIHIRNVIEPNKTFRNFLDEWVVKTGPNKGQGLKNGTKTGIMNFFKNVMDYYCQKNIERIFVDPSYAGKLLTINPIGEIDTVWKYNKKNKTTRTAVRADYVEMAKEILLSPDEKGNPTFAWAHNHPSLSYDWVRISSDTICNWPWKKIVSGETFIWQPSRVLALYMMFELPLRTFQTRWLDSGIGDEKYWSLKDSKYLINHRSFSQKGRQWGIFKQIESYDLISNTEVCFHISTNKTQIWNPEDLSGFPIPWPVESLYETIQIQREWADIASELFFTEPVTIADADLNVNPKIRHLMPDIFPLFRDVTNQSGENLPISKGKMYTCYVSVCLEIQERFRAKGIHVELVRESSENAEKKYIAIHDLHSLRVTGITDLVRKGIPIETICMLVGHSAIAMTLHYEKRTPLEIRVLLSKMFERNTKESNKTDISKILELIEGRSNLSNEELMNLVGADWFRRFLIMNSEANENQAPILLEASRGHWTVRVDGICPGALCSEGDLEGGPVFGGPGSCGNCKFFITGTAFLYGQAHKANLLMYEMKSLAEDLVHWRGIQREFDPGDYTYEEAISRISEIQNKLSSLNSDWWGRYRLFQTSLQLLEKDSKENKNSLITTAQAGEIGMVIKKTNKFELLKELSLSTEIMSVDLGFKGPEVELREMLNIILSKCGEKPLLLGLPKDKSRLITNLFADAMTTIFTHHVDGSPSLAYERMFEIANSESSIELPPSLISSINKLSKSFTNADNFEKQYIRIIDSIQND